MLMGSLLQLLWIQYLNENGFLLFHMCHVSLGLWILHPNPKRFAGPRQSKSDNTWDIPTSQSVIKLSLLNSPKKITWNPKQNLESPFPGVHFQVRQFSGVCVLERLGLHHWSGLQIAICMVALDGGRFAKFWLEIFECLAPTNDHSNQNLVWWLEWSWRSIQESHHDTFD